MRAHGLRGVSRRRAWCVVRDDPARQGPAPGAGPVQRELTATGINQRWVADMTDIPTWAGFVYLGLVRGVYGRKLVDCGVRRFGIEAAEGRVVAKLNTPAAIAGTWTSNGSLRDTAQT